MRKGLLDIQSIKKVLDKERELTDYRALRRHLGEDEPVLDKNIKHWIKQELNHLRTRYPSLAQDQLDWVGHLLERFLVRGFFMCREANAELLSNWFQENCDNPPEHEKVDDAE